MTFKRIYEYAIDKAPQLAPRNTHIIHEWLAKGYDAEKDIIPAIEQATKHGANAIHSFAYFSGYINKNHEKRIKEAHKPIELTAEQRNAMRAKTIAIKQRAGIYVPDSDLAWLQHYQGEVTA